MGALVGGIYACGKLSGFTDWLLALQSIHIGKCSGKECERDRDAKEDG